MLQPLEEPNKYQKKIEQIGNGEVKMVLHELSKEHPHNRELHLLKSRFHRLEKQVAQNLVRDEDERLERTKITKSLIDLVNDLADRKPAPKEGTSKHKSQIWLLGLGAIGILIAVIFAYIQFGSKSQTVALLDLAKKGVHPQQESINTQMTNRAWKAYDKQDYAEAIAYSRRCIQEFRNQAFAEQARLEKLNFPKPKTACPTCLYADKDSIFARGVLNDVATCYFILGVSSTNLGQKEHAINAFEASTKLNYALTFDQSYLGFWSPAEKAQVELQALLD